MFGKCGTNFHMVNWNIFNNVVSGAITGAPSSVLLLENSDEYITEANDYLIQE